MKTHCEKVVSNKAQESQPKQPLKASSFAVALLGLLVAIWSAYEAHSARIEARSAIAAAERSAAAAETSNRLATRSQSSYLVPSIQRSGDAAAVSVKNVGNNVALNVRYGYFLYTGPLKSVKDVSAKLGTTPLRQLALALGGSAEATVIDSLATGNGTRDLKTSFSVPVAKFDSNGVPHLEMRTETVNLGTVSVPSKTLVIGIVSFEDGLNIQHGVTFCFPLNSTLDDPECSKLNSLQLNGAVADEVKAAGPVPTA